MICQKGKNPQLLFNSFRHEIQVCFRRMTIKHNNTSDKLVSV